MINPGQALWYKTVFIADSEDGGVTWQDLRPLTNVLGQCYGFAIGLSDGSVVVTHDHRYPPGTPCGRAMVSHDEGRTWQDEVYYLYYGMGQSGYNQSVMLDENEILTIAATSNAKDDKQEQLEGGRFVGNTDLTAIRWRLQD